MGIGDYSPLMGKNELVDWAKRYQNEAKITDIVNTYPDSEKMRIRNSIKQHILNNPGCFDKRYIVDGYVSFRFLKVKDVIQGLSK